MKVGSLFTGIGGFDLGLERVGHEIRWQVEIDPFCQKVLERHWPNVTRYEDVRLVGEELERVDIICGGFPCQDISGAGKGAGIVGARSGLWREFARLIGTLRPSWVVAENVSTLRSRGLTLVLQDLHALGYDAEWHCIPASAVGAPHQRDRIWILAYASGVQRDGGDVHGGGNQASPTTVSKSGNRCPEISSPNTNGVGPDAGISGGNDKNCICHLDGHGPCPSCGWTHNQSWPPRFDWWSVEPNVGRVAHGVPARVDRLKSLGNALLPQIAEWIGRRLT